MTLLRRPVFASYAATLTIASLLNVPSCAIAAPPTSAVLAKNGEVSIRQGDADSLASIRVGIFEPGWTLRGTTFDPASGTARIIAATAGSTVVVKPVVTSDGKNLRVSVAFTADKDTPVNSSHVSLYLPVYAYVGGTAVWTGTEGSKSFVIPPAPGETRITEGKNGSLTIAGKNGAGKITAKVAGDTGLLLQDGRVFSGTELEVRIGGINAHTLKAGQTETVEFTLELPDTVAIEAEKPLVMQAGADWIPLAPKSLNIEPGSALDFSAFLSDAPAGKYGRLITRPDGHFAFEKRGTPQRFYGGNLCFTANYLEHAEADELADRLQRLGYNTVRIHHYEGDLIDRNVADSLTFRPEQLDKLDYLIAALKKRGLYINTDLFVSRPVKPAEMGLTEGGMDDFKDAVLVSKPAMDNWKSFSKKLLNHVNPYTKIAYKDEPALAWISLINEPNLTDGRLGAWKGKLRELFETEWKNWYAKRYAGKTAPALPDSLNNNDAMGRDLGAFFAFLHQRGWNEMSGFLRNEVGTKALLTYMNGWSEAPAFMATRNSFDYVDNHFYWDHPSFLGASWGLPSTGSSGNASAAAAGGAGPSSVAITRLFGKPFTVSEWDYVFPNRYRAEGGLIMGSISALQDWDALWHFAYSHGRESVIAPRPADYFNVAQDPLRQAAERTAILMFLRGDVAVANSTTTNTVSVKDLTEPTPSIPLFSPATSYMTTAKFGIALKENGKPVESRDRNTMASILQKITVDKDSGQFAVSTPKTVSLTLADEASWKNRDVALHVAGARAVLAVSSLDHEPIVSSKHLLISHLTDLQNTNQRFSSRDRRVLEVGGELPYLVRRGSATVNLIRADAGTIKAWRLDTTGKRVAPLPVTVTKDSATLELSTLAPDGSATLYYEVVVP